MKNILLFGGTTEGKILAEYLEKMKIPCYVSVATEYGKEVLPKFTYCRVINGRMDEEKMQAFFIQNHIELVIDATHPYAVEVTKNIKNVSAKCNIEYLRVLRAANEKLEKGRYFKSIEDLIAYINENPKNTLVTTGSKEIKQFKKVLDYQKYIYARVLPMENILEECYKLGFSKEHVIGMKGPFTVSQNLEQIDMCKAEYLVTKDTGNEGGFPEKYQAAMRAGIEMLIIERPMDESGMTIPQVKQYIVDNKAADITNMFTDNTIDKTLGNTAGGIAEERRKVWEE